MSTPPNPSRPPFSGRQRRAAADTDAAPSRSCRVCRTALALPDDETCEACGQQAINRARAGVDSWLSMHAERVRELEREEHVRGDRA